MIAMVTDPCGVAYQTPSRANSSATAAAVGKTPSTVNRRSLADARTAGYRTCRLRRRRWHLSSRSADVPQCRSGCLRL